MVEAALVLVASGAVAPVLETNEVKGATAACVVAGTPSVAVPVDGALLVEGTFT